MSPKLNVTVPPIFARLVLLGLSLWFLASHQATLQSNLKWRDSLVYWATAKQMVHGDNPYSIPAVRTLEASAGYSAELKTRMYRPPAWALWMVLPLGWLSAYWAWIVWTGISLAAFVASIRILWRLYGNQKTIPTNILIACYSFAPVIACLVSAQMGLLLLLSVAFFFILIELEPFFAGMVLIVPMAKPHLFLPLAIALAIWVIVGKRWEVAKGAALAFVLANSLAVVLDPHVFSHYREMLVMDQMQNEFRPNLSGFIRVLFFRQHFFMQFAPAVLGMLWAAAYTLKHRAEWRWPKHGLWLLVVGVLVAPYTGITDEAIILPAVVQGVAWLSAPQRLKLRTQFALLIFVLFDLLLLLMIKAEVDPLTGIYFWTGLLWLAWWSWVNRVHRASSLLDKSITAPAQPRPEPAQRPS